MRIFLLGTNVEDDAVVCDLGVLGDFVPVDEKQVLVTYMSPSLWKSCPISFDMPLLHFSFLGPLVRYWYSWAFPVSGQMTEISLPGCNGMLPVTWSMTVQSSPDGRTRGDGLLVVEGGVFIVAIWFSMRYFPWRHIYHVLYWCCFGTSGVSTDFWCAVGGIGLVSSRIMCGTRWGGCLGARPGWNDM